jgi:hypothetical protein
MERRYWTMANLERIEMMRKRLQSLGEPTEPPWIRGWKTRDMHLSGSLREASMNWSLPIEIEDLLDEAAETLDDAHEMWLAQLIVALEGGRDASCLDSGCEEGSHKPWCDHANTLEGRDE